MSDEKKIIVDEDWKSQVEAEKQVAEHASEKKESQPSDEPKPASEAADMQFPPASFDLLLTTLATKALMALGQVPNPTTGKSHANRNQAKYLIDTIDMLREKTKGNLSPDEQQAIEGVLHQLRMVFVATESGPGPVGS